MADTIYASHDASAAERGPDIPVFIDPDRWQAALPEPFSFLNEILHETIDDVMLRLHIKEEIAQLEDAKAVPDSEEGVTAVGATLCHALPEALAAAGSDALLEIIADGVVAIALSSGTLWLWDVVGGAEPVQLGETAAGMAPCVLACAQLPASSGPPPRKRLALLSAKPAVAESAPDGLPPPAGAEDAQLLVFDLTPPNPFGGHDAGDGRAWEGAPVADFKLAALAPARATLSPDGRFCACALTDASVAVYHLPLPTPVVAPVEEGSKLRASAPSAAAPPPAAAMPDPALVATLAPLGAAATAVTSHFLLAPAPRSLGEPLSWVSCGVLCWAEGGSQLVQRMLPSPSMLAAAAKGSGGPVEAQGIEWLLPGRMLCSAVSTDSVLLATGLDEGSVVLWDTNVRSDRYVLQRHAAPVEHVALLGTQLLASYASDATLHAYDVSNDPETGMGKLVFRRRLDVKSVRASWLAISSPLPLVLLGCADVRRTPRALAPLPAACLAVHTRPLPTPVAHARCPRMPSPLARPVCIRVRRSRPLVCPQAVRLYDFNGDLLSRLAPPPDRTLLAARPGPCGLAHAAQQLNLACLSAAAAPAVATGSPADADADAPASAPAEEATVAPDAAGPPSSAFLGYSTAAVLMATYPHLAGLVGGDASVPLLVTLLRSYTHIQRTDANLMARAPLLERGGTLSVAGSKRGGTAGSSTRSLSKGQSGRSVGRGGANSKPRRESGAGLSTVAEEDGSALLQHSRVSSVRSSVRSAGLEGSSSDDVRAGGAGRPGLSEQALRDRQVPNTAGSSTFGGGSQVGRGSMSGLSRVPTADGAERRSMDGRASMSGTLAPTVASSVGTAISDASRGEPPFIDPVAKVQRLQRSRLHGRFSREARVQRRWDELKALAASMQQQEQQQRR